MKTILGALVAGLLVVVGHDGSVPPVGRQTWDSKSQFSGVQGQDGWLLGIRCARNTK